MIVKFIIADVPKLNIVDDHIVVGVRLRKLKNYGVKLRKLMLHYHLVAGYPLRIAFLQCTGLIGVYHHLDRVIAAKLHRQAVVLHGRFQSD